MDEDSAETTATETDETKPEFVSEPIEGPTADDAALFVQTNPDEAMATHALLTQALQDAGHLPTDPLAPSPVDNDHVAEGCDKFDLPAHSLLDEIRAYVHSHASTAENLHIRDLITKLKEML